jgi:hypothetical protein
MANNTGLKYGGRSEGTPNKITKVIKESLTTIVNNELEQLPLRLNELNNRERIIVLTKLLPLILPKAIIEDESIKLDMSPLYLDPDCPHCNTKYIEIAERLSKVF